MFSLSFIILPDYSSTVTYDATNPLTLLSLACINDLPINVPRIARVKSQLPNCSLR
jgi:hypothetical protein